MNYEKRSAIILILIKQMREKGSWCGETHLQKAIYFLQEMMRVDFKFNFILYKHGAFSFDLSNHLQDMIGDNYLLLESQLPYGPSFLPGKSAKNLAIKYISITTKYNNDINFVASKLGKLGVKELEKYATALFVVKTNGLSLKKKAKRLNKLKPHISLNNALSAIKWVNNLTKISKKLKKAQRVLAKVNLF